MVMGDYMRSGGTGGVSGAGQNIRGAPDELTKVIRAKQHVPPRWQVLLRAASISIAAITTSVAFAATTTVSTLIDADNNVASGCSISTVNGAFAGVDRVLNTVVVTDAAGYRISSITQQSCSGATLDPSTVVDSSSTPLARGNGTNSTTAVETYLPNVFLPATGQKMRIAITTLGSDGLIGADALTAAGAGPILVDGPPLVVVPTLAKLSLALTALLLALSVWFARRRGWHGMQLVIVAALAISMSGQLIAEIVRDGFIGDWTGIASVATDPTGDAPAGTDITTLYSTVDRNNVYFRIDTVLNAPPVANAQSVVAVANIALPITLTGADFEASPLTFTVVTQPAHGVLTGTAPNLVYTANSSYGGPDSFTFRANDGVLNSADATVTIGVKLPPTITSLDNATFIPGQANSFNFTATGAPSATFALSACNVALPPSISVTNNGNNTATLAGNPSVAEGGTYVCTLTASNGFGNSATQAFTLNLGLPPTFTSANATTFTVGSAGSFTVTTTATPTTTGITQTGALPTGVSFAYNGPGTPLNGTLAGTAAAGTGGIYPITLTSANGIPPNTVQNFTLTVNQTPAITSANNTTCFVGVICSFTVTASGFPVPAIGRSGAALPAGMNYVDNGNGTGTLSGTLALGTVNAYAVTFTPGNGVGAPTAQAFTLTVAKASQTISFTSAAPTGASVGGATYTVTATATSTLTPAFSIDAAATAVCSISGATVSLTGVGTCVINANQAGNADFSAAPQVQQSFAVVKGNQTIAFTSASPVAAKVAGSTYAVVATASPSGLPVAFSIDASALSVCSISGATVSLLTVGTCVINANQPGNASYNAAPQVQQSFAVAKGDQTIAFTSTAPAAAKVGGATYTVTATSSPSALPVTFSVDAPSAAVCSILGATVSFTTVGTCVINANQAGNTNYNAALQVQQTFAIAKGDQTLSFTSMAPSAAKVAGATYTVTAIATSGLAPAFSIDASATAVCSIAGATVSFTGVGNCVINANQAGNTNFNAATQIQQSFAVAKGDQTIVFTSAAPAAPKVAGTTYTVTATATSGLTVALTIDASAASVCAISGSTVSFIGSGACVINGNQAGNATYSVAPQVQQSFAVAKGDQTISFTSTAPAAAQVGGATYTVSANSTSGLAVTFAIDASASGVCTISGTTVTFVGAGTCVANANQAGNANYNAAPQLQQTFAVGKGSQSISFTSAAPVNAAPSGPTYTVAATASSGLAVVFTIDAAATSVCSISGSTVSFTTPGTCVINANQAGNVNFNAALQVQQSFAVSKLSQSITFASAAPAGAAVGGATYTVTANATSALAVAFMIDASAASVCAISGSTVSFIGVGTCVINANQAGNSTYFAALQVQQSFAVAKGSQTISFTSTAPSNASIGGSTYAVAATASSGLTVSFTIAAASASVCSISGSTVSFISSGTCTVNADQAGSANFNAAPQAQQSFSVFQAPTISAISNATFSIGAAGTGTFTVTGFPTPALALSGCTLPSGLSLVGNQITGTPNMGATSVSGCIVTASNGVLPNASTAAFTVTIVLAPPVVATSGGTSAFTEDGPAVVVDGGVTVMQAGGTNLASGSISITGGLVNTEDVLTFTNQNGISGIYTAATGVLVLTGSSSLANYQTALRTINYSNTSQNPSTANRTVQFVVNDGTANSNVAAKTVTVTSVNDAPLLATPAATLSYTESGLPAAVNSVITVSDIDSPSLIGATAAVTAGFVSGQDALSYVTALGITGSFNSGTGVLTLSGTASVANYETALRNVLYNNLSNDPSNGVTGTTSRTISFQVNDGAAVNNLSNIVSSTVNVTAVNNPPTATPLSGLYAQAGIPITYPAGTLGGTDAEPGTIVSVVTTPDSVCAGCTLSIAADGSFVFTPPPSAAGTPVNFTYHVMDNGRPGPGVTGSSATVGFTVAGPAIYFVKSPAVGAGNCNLGSECTLAAALASIGAATNTRIFISDANTYTPGVAVTLNAGGWLLGQGVTGAASFDSLFGITTSGSGTLTARPSVGLARPTISGPPATVTMSTSAGFPNAAVRGLNIDVSAGANKGLRAIGLSAAGTLAVSDINVTSASGAAIDMSNALAVNLSITGSPNVVSSTTGTALNVVNTTIAAAGLNFRSISAGTGASGPANGIVLNNTGTLGGLKVLGNGGACTVATPTCTGGQIQRTSGDGILMTNTVNPTLTRMNIRNNLGSGIRGNTLNGFVLDSALVTDNGNNVAIDEAGVELVELTGTIAAGTNPTRIVDTTIRNSFEFELQITNTSGSLADLVMSGNTLSTDGASGQHGNLFNFLALGNANMKLSMTSGTFTGVAPNSATGVQCDHSGSSGGTVTCNVSGTTFTNNNVAVSVSQANAGNLKFDVSGNTATGNRAQGLNLFVAAVGTGSVDGQFVNNVVGTAGVAGSASDIGFGIRVQNEGVNTGPPVNVLISGNTVQHTTNFSAINVNQGIVGQATSKATNVTVINNVLRNVANGRAIVVQQNNTTSASSAGTTCVDVRGNAMTNIAGQAGDGSKIRLRRLDGNGGVFNVVQASVAALAAANSPPATAVGEIAVGGTPNFGSVSSCPQPSL